MKHLTLLTLMIALLVGYQPFARSDEQALPVPTTRIAIVNVASLLENAPQSKAADAQLKQDFVPREKKLEADQKTIRQLEDELAARIAAGTLPESEKVQRQRELRDRERTYARQMEDFREEVRLARDAAVDRLQAEIILAIGEVREQAQIDLVLRESNYIVASDRIDITPKVMDYLEQKFQGLTATPAPTSGANQ